MHQPFFVVDAFFQGYHGFCSADPFDIVYLEDDIFSVRGIFRPDLAKNIELTGCNVSHRDIGDLF